MPEALIQVTDSISINEDEIEERFVRASGPGGQHVNRSATAVQLRFDVAGSTSLPEAVRERLLRLVAGRLSGEGVLVIEARRYRSQERNRQDARARLLKWIRRAAASPKPRRPTKPTRGSEQRRLEEKRRQSQKKRRREPPRQDD